MGRTYIACIIGMRNAYKIFVGKPEGTRPPWRIYEQNVRVPGRTATYEDKENGERKC